jgi:hypothetical protein
VIGSLSQPSSEIGSPDGRKKKTGVAASRRRSIAASRAPLDRRLAGAARSPPRGRSIAASRAPLDRASRR